MSMRLSRSVVGEAEARAVSRVITEDGYLGMATKCAFLKKWAQHLGVKPSQVITVNTGTAALHLAVDAAAAQCHVSGTPKFSFLLYVCGVFSGDYRSWPHAGGLDVLADTGTIDLADAERRLTPVPLPLCPCTMPRKTLAARCAAHGFAREKGPVRVKTPPMPFLLQKPWPHDCAARHGVLQL